MSLDSVRADLTARAPDLAIIEVAQSTATVAEAAVALQVEPGQIAKRLALRVNDSIVLLVTRGDTRLDNQKTKAAFGGRPRMPIRRKPWPRRVIRWAVSARSGWQPRSRFIAM